MPMGAAEASDEKPGTPVSPARCRHFGVCGGCARQDVGYEAQVAQKEEELRGILGQFAAALRPAVPSPSPWFYRNKMEYAFGFEHGELALGLRRRGRFFGVVNLSECFIMSEAAGEVIAETRDWAVRHSLVPYHLRKHEGLLRYLTLREGKRTGQLLAILATTSPPDEALFNGLLDELGGGLREKGVTSFLWSVTEREADLAVGEIRRTVFGSETFEETMAGVKFVLSPYAFFQPNVDLAEKLAEHARVLLGSSWPVLLDLYCGVGGLTFPLSRSAEKVIGVELEPTAVSDAQKNASLNGIGNCQFVAEDSLSFIRRFSNYSFMADRWALLLDPPRSGMHPKMPAQILRVAPPVIIYVSCSPRKLAEDLKFFSRDYRLEEATPYDFFPHTPHIEVLAKLARK